MYTHTINYCHGMKLLFLLLLIIPKIILGDVIPADGTLINFIVASVKPYKIVDPTRAHKI